MQYLNNVPQASQSLGQTQMPIQANFTTIDAAFQQDHVPYTLSGQGKHNMVTLVLQSPAPTITPPDGGLFNALDTFSGANQLFAQNPVTGVSYPFTASNLSQNGWCYLPSGIIMQWGLSSISAVIFPKAFLTQILSITATLTFPASSGTIFTSAPSKTGFTATATPAGNFYWIALGS